jgi:protein SCO1
MKKLVSCGPAARALRALAAGAALCALWPAVSAPPVDAEASAHAAHHLKGNGEVLRRAVVNYQLPAVRLIRDDGKPVWLREEIDDGRPVYLDFIYTTCTAICPVTSATFEALQDRLGSARDKVHMMSISIDPEEDTPRRLADFRKKYDAGPQWHHYTGTTEASVATQRAFGVYTGDKMGHTPVTLFRAAPDKPWVRLDGFATPDQLLAEVKAILGGH